MEHVTRMKELRNTDTVSVRKSERGKTGRWWGGSVNEMDRDDGML
jgi:hypothetical protein